MYQTLLPHASRVAAWTERLGDVQVKDDWREISPDSPIICTGDLTSDNVRFWLNHDYPAFYLARGYVGNHLYKQRLWHRVCMRGWANTLMGTPPYSRWDKINLKRHPWKVKDIRRVLIAPSKMTSKFWTPELGYGWASTMLDKFPGAEVKIRPKLGKAGPRWSTLWQDFDWADLVVSQSSAITAEAFWYGKKAISTEPCVTWAASRSTLADWKDPTEPSNREQWHEHLAWSQYTTAEIESGEAIELLQQYLGPIMQYDRRHDYSFTT